MDGSPGMRKPAQPLEEQENKIKETSAVSEDVKSTGDSWRAAPQSQWLEVLEKALFRSRSQWSMTQPM